MVHPKVFRRLILLFFALLFALASTVPVQAQETVTVDLTVTSVTLAKTGDLIITGTLTCSEPAQAVVRGDASEQVGRNLVSGSGEVPNFVECGPVATTYTLSIAPQVYAFRPGQVNVVVYAFICAPDFAICSINGADSVDQTFRVKPSR